MSPDKKSDQCVGKDNLLGCFKGGRGCMNFLYRNMYGPSRPIYFTTKGETGDEYYNKNV